MSSFQFLDQIRRELVANSPHTADATQLDIVESRRQCVLSIMD